MRLAPTAMLPPKSVKRVSQGKEYGLWAKVRVKVWVKVNVMTSEVDVRM